jgi:hypothetical protein
VILFLYKRTKQKEKAMQENTDNKLSYQGDMGDGSSVYHMLLDGRVVFVARVDKAEKDMPIYIRKHGVKMDSLDNGWMKTALRAFTVDDGSRVSAMSMKEAVYGNLPFLLADLLYGPIAK